MLLHRVIIHQVLGLFSHSAHHGHHVSGVGVHDGDAGLELVALGGMDVQVGGVRIDIFGDLLDIRVHGAVDLVAAVVHQPLGRLIGDALGVRQVAGDVLDQLLHKPVVDLDAVGLLTGAVGITGGVRKVQGLRLGGFALLLRQIGLAGIGIDDLRHLVQDQLLTALVQLPGGDGGAVLPGVGPVILGVIQGGIVGDGDDAGTLRRRQVLGGLAEVVLRRRLHAVAAAA